MLGRLRRLVAPAVMLQLVGVLEAVEVARQRRRGAERSLVASSADRDPASVRWLALTWWPAGAAAVAVAAASRLGMRRHPSYTGMWREMTGVGLAWGNPASVAACALVPLIGISRRIAGEERELAASLPGYQSYAQGKARLVPFIW